MGKNPSVLRNVTTIPDTGTGQNCILQSELRSGRQEFRKEAPATQARDANKNPLVTRGTISMNLQVWTTLEKTKFLTCECLSVHYLLGASFIDLFLQWIRIASQTVVMHDGSKTDISRRPVPGTSPAANAACHVTELGGRASAKVRVANPPEYRQHPSGG